MIDNELLKKKAKILELRDKIKEQGRKGKVNFEKEWYRNVLFFVGKQWIVWNKSRKTWAEASDDDIPKWYPRPVTNKFSSAAVALTALLTQKEPRIIVTPATDSEEDIAVAELGDVWVDVIKTEADTRRAKRIAAAWKTLTGNCFFYNFAFADSESGTTFIPFEQCQDCGQVSPPDAIQEAGGACPECKGQNLGAAVGPDGNQIGAQKPNCRMKQEAVSPFEMFFNQEVEDFAEVRELVRSKIVPVDDLKAAYPDLKDQIGAGGAEEEISEMYQKALAYITNLGDERTAQKAGGAAIVPSEGVDYLFTLPTEEFPKGLMATIIGNEIAELSDMEGVNQDKQGKYFLPFVHSGAIKVPGRFWYKTRMDDIVSKQIERNKLQSFLLIWLYTIAAGKWLKPKGSGMVTPTGDPDQVLEYTPVGPSGAKPDLVRGLPPPPIIIQLLELIDKEIEDLSANYDVLKGQLPSGLDTFAGLRLLTERAFSVHGEMIDNWETADENCMRQLLEIARNCLTEERKKTFQNEIGSWETKKFSKADLQGGVDIKVEHGSTIMKSPTVENAAIIDSVKMGLIDASNPKVNFKILEKLGQSELAAPIREDIKDASAEWQDFLASVLANPMDKMKWVLRPRPGIDNEALHYQDAASRCKTPEFFNLPPEAQMMWIEHATVHKANLEADLAAQAMQEAGPGAAPRTGAGPKLPPAGAPTPEKPPTPKAGLPKEPVGV